MLGFQLGELPVKYLGVPLISTKLKYEDCKPLIDRITKRVQSWTSKCLSYAGRLVLVQSILFSIQVFWSLHFIFPKKVSNAMEQILRRFLWVGAELKKGGSKVAWDEVCLPKCEGGLGIRRIHEWNKAAMLRHIWALCSRGSSLWVEWSIANILKGRCFWEIKAPSDCSWTWRKLLKLRSEAIHLSKYIVGDGKSISLWHSNWHPKGPLIPKYSPRIAYDAGLPKVAKVSSIIHDGQWKWPFPNTWELREIVLECPPDYSPQPHQNDQFIWLISKDGVYHSATTWNALRSRRQSVPWHNLTWFPSHIPRHSFILWLAIRERLATKDKLARWGMPVDPTCILCGNDLENLEHLFFKCPFAAEVRNNILQMCQIVKPIQPWQEEIKWAAEKFKGKHPKNSICKLAWAALVYHIWQERNARIFKRLTSNPTSIIDKIKQDVRSKASIMSFKYSEES